MPSFTGLVEPARYSRPYVGGATLASDERSRLLETRGEHGETSSWHQTANLPFAPYPSPDASQRPLTAPGSTSAAAARPAFPRLVPPILIPISPYGANPESASSSAPPRQRLSRKSLSIAGMEPSPYCASPDSAPPRPLPRLPRPSSAQSSSPLSPRPLPPTPADNTNRAPSHSRSASSFSPSTQSSMRSSPSTRPQPLTLPQASSSAPRHARTLSLVSTGARSSTIAEPLSPLTPLSPPSPAPPTVAEIRRQRIQKMAKLTRHLGECPPAELVFGSEPIPEDAEDADDAVPARFPPPLFTRHSAPEHVAPRSKAPGEARHSSGARWMQEVGSRRWVVEDYSNIVNRLREL